MLKRLRAYIAMRNFAKPGVMGGKATPARGYLLITYPHDYGWIALMPDFRGAMGRARNIEQATKQAILAAQKVSTAMGELGKSHPEPMDLAAVRDHPVWTHAYGINWTQAIVHCVPMNALFPKTAKASLGARSESSGAPVIG